jgi:hypothetical protein
VARTRPFTQFHKDGSVWAKGQTLDGETHGYWEWFRKDGVIMRSGSFDRGVQVGEWTTYNSAGKPHKVTRMESLTKVATKAPSKKSAGGSAKPAAKAKKVEPSDDDLLVKHDHPLKAEVGAVRKTILGVDKSISDGVKWNSLSFRTSEWFATWNWRVKDQVQLVLHLGAKNGKMADRDSIPDPKGLLEWKGQDRALANLGSGAKLKANLPALKAILKAWIRYV